MLRQTCHATATLLACIYPNNIKYNMLSYAYTMSNTYTVYAVDLTLDLI